MSFSRAVSALSLSPSRADVVHHANELIDLVFELDGLAVHLRKRRGEQHRASHHLECILAPRDHDGRRIAAHALQRCKQPGDMVVALGERDADHLFLGLELAEPGFGRRELAPRSFAPGPRSRAGAH